MRKSTKTAEKNCSAKASSAKMTSAKASKTSVKSAEKTTDCAGSKKCGKSSCTRSK